MDKITKFKGEYGFLSNFYPCTVTYNDHEYGSAEVAYQSEKCAKEKDRLAISQMDSKKAKASGKKILRKSNWHEIKLEAMYGIVKAKFTQNENLKKKLLATGNSELIESNSWRDKFWGTNLKLEGENHLGRILMKVREEIRTESE